jgi:hydrogenase nickel incorporation protein HypA/HybF
MHEFSLAEEVASIVAANAGCLARVSRVTLSIGELAGVEVDALRFALMSTLRGGKAESAEVEIENVPALGRCPRCGSVQHVEARFDDCDACGAAGLQLLQGDRMVVSAIAGDALN